MGERMSEESVHEGFNADPAHASYRMDAHGSITHIGDGSPPGKSRQILRGTFAIITYESRNREPETMLILIGREPTERRLVYKFLVATTLDSPILAMGKEQDGNVIGSTGEPESEIRSAFVWPPPWEKTHPYELPDSSIDPPCAICGKSPAEHVNE